MTLDVSTPAVPLFERLPEIYRVRDAEQSPPDQLRAYLAAVEQPFSALHANIGQLYDDLFIDTCDDWVIPYLADLLGTTHLKGDPRTLRADVADTIALRRRKGTLGAIERLAVNLTGWACRAVELRERLGWAQHLNHQRPDAGGAPPYGDARLIAVGHRMAVRGGTAAIRDPAALALLGTPFDDLAYTADVKPGGGREHSAQALRINLPNLAVFLWRLQAHRLRLVQPLAKGATDLGPQPLGLARFAVRIDLHPLDIPVRLFNTSRPGFRQPGASGGVISPLTEADAVPGPLLDARITSGSQAGHPEAYVAIDFFDDAPTPPTGFDLGDVGLHLFLPQSEQPVFATTVWRFRGDNLCAWETGLRRPLRDGELVIDPDIGRVLIGVGNLAQRNALVDAAGTTPRIFASFTYGAPGPVGAHPITRAPAAATVPTALPTLVLRASALPGGSSLQSLLANLDTATQPVVIQIDDSLVHRVDLAAVPGTVIDGGNSLRLAQSLTIRAADGHRPIVLLARPLNFRPVNAAAANIAVPVVRLEGLYIAADAASFPAGAALIERAAVARLEVVGCTLAPGGHSLRSGARAALQPAMRLANGYGFTLPADEAAFVPTPDIVLQRSICGALAIDERYRLDIQDSIIDAGRGVGDPPGAPGAGLAIGAATAPASNWAAALDFNGLTCFGGVRVAAVGGAGGIFTQSFAVLDNQHGCIKHSSFSAQPNRLPPNHFCVHAPDARQAFVSQRFNAPGYAQLADGADRRIRTLGPGDDAMGAYGFLLDAHKWANLNIRLNEFMPVGVRPLTVPVT